MTDPEQLRKQREAMERQRFGFTRKEVLAAKGEKCSIPLQFPGDYHEGKLIIDHTEGGGRHDTERGMIVKDLTHNMDNLRVVCERHGGMMDRMNFVRGVGRNTKGNSNNPSQ